MNLLPGKLMPCKSLALQKEVDSLANQPMLQGVLKHNNKDNVESLKTLVTTEATTENEEGSEHLMKIETNLQNVVLDKENLDIDDAGDKQITTSDTTKFKCVTRFQSYFGGLSLQFASILAIASLFIITLATTLYWKLYTPKRELSQTVQILNLIAYYLIEEFTRPLLRIGRGIMVYSFLFHCLFFPVQIWIDFEFSKRLKPTFDRIRQPNFLIISLAIMSLVISLACHYIRDVEISQITSLVEQTEHFVEMIKHFTLNDLWYYSGIIHVPCIPIIIWYEYMEEGNCINFNPYKPFKVDITWEDVFFVWELSSIFALAIYFYDDLVVFFEQYSTPEPTLLEKTSTFIFGEPQPEQDLIEHSFDWMLHTPMVEWIRDSPLVECITDNIEPLIEWMKDNIDIMTEWIKDNIDLLVEWMRNTSLVEWMSNNLLISLELFVLTSPIIMYLVFYTIVVAMSTTHFIGLIILATFRFTRTLTQQMTWKTIIHSLVLSSILMTTSFYLYTYLPLMAISGYLPQLTGLNTVLELGNGLVFSVINICGSFFLAVISPLLIIMIHTDITNGIALSKILYTIKRNVTLKNMYLVLQVTFGTLCVAIYFKPESAFVIFSFIQLHLPTLLHYLISGISFTVNLYIGLFFGIFLPLLITWAHVILANLAVSSKQ
ncbi:uncharacterized protein [Clytia hemisphaerica]|uniref:uncharacterized protein n=1 Tax=Clytia hemisphaerica TaxID=252671 RepID=UPI0034D3FA06